MASPDNMTAVTTGGDWNASLTAGAVGVATGAFSVLGGAAASALVRPLAARLGTAVWAARGSARLGGTLANSINGLATGAVEGAAGGANFGAIGAAMSGGAPGDILDSAGRGAMWGSLIGTGAGATMPWLALGARSTYNVARAWIGGLGRGPNSGFGVIGLDRIPTGPTSSAVEALYLQRASSPAFRAKLWVSNQLARLVGGRAVSANEITEALANTEFRQAGLLSSSARQSGSGYLIGGSTRGGYFAREVADHELLHMGQFLRNPTITTRGLVGLMHEVAPAFVGSPAIYTGGTMGILCSAYGIYRTAGGDQ